MSTKSEVPDTSGWTDKLTDFDFSEMPDEEVTEPETTPTPVVGSPLPSHVDSEVAVEAAGEANLWMGIRFDEIPAELKQKAWTELRRWVDQFLIQQNFTDVVAACWFQHPDAVNELYATLCAEYKVWEEGAPSVGPFLSFQSYLPGLKQRLRDSTMKSCLSSKRHSWDVPAPLAYDQEAWEKVRDTVTDVVTVQREDQTVEVRAKVKNEELAATSPARKIGPVRQQDRVLPAVTVRDRAAAGEVLVQVLRHRDDEIQWQIQHDGQWEHLDVETTDDIVDMSGE
ncbi:hypothetical protein [Glutamicibacter arilaitensis]|uniref:hypothetical protein n=1 Tax=Glutamicibacter TaxID=1742989 RepID=UPI003F91885B